MALRPLLCSALLLGGLVSWPAAGRADTSTVTSSISEVDACNQAQYLMPEKAVLQGFRLSSKTTKTEVHFTCTVAWSTTVKPQPTYRPILFPAPVAIPLLGSGWL